MIGVYVDSNDGDRILRLRLEAGKLWGGPLQGESYELEALNDNRFRYLVFPTELEFERSVAGAPIGLTAYVRGMKPLQFSRVSAYEPTNAQLQEFTGVFRSDEIEMPYNVALEDNHLALRSLKTKDRALLPVAPDLFVGADSQRIRFTRDAQGRISGALLNTGRTRNFRFERAAR
jgi:YD repeat-containing protein